MSEPAQKSAAQPAPQLAAASPAPLRERWTQWVALTTTVLAVCAAISALKGGSCSTRVQLATTQENNAWSYFQSKSIKQHVVETQRDQLELLRAEARTPEGRRLATERIARAQADIARYEKDKAQIMADAKRLAAQQDGLKRNAAAFGMAVMLLQIGIMLSSVAALIKRPAMWVAGLVFGATGLVYMANGFWLFF